MAFVYREPVDADALTLQESEVESVRWFPLEEIAAELQIRHDRICVTEQGLQVLTNFLNDRHSGRKGDA